jgi:hypothetical protein
MKTQHEISEQKRLYHYADLLCDLVPPYTPVEVTAALRTERPNGREAFIICAYVGLQLFRASAPSYEQSLRAIADEHYRAQAARCTARYLPPLRDSDPPSDLFSLIADAVNPYPQGSITLHGISV